MDDGACSYCLNRLWIETRAGRRHFLCAGWTDWERVMEEQADECPAGPAGDAERERIDALDDAGACERHQARALGVSVPFLREATTAAEYLAYAHRDDDGLPLVSAPEGQPELEPVAGQ